MNHRPKTRFKKLPGCRQSHKTAFGWVALFEAAETDTPTRQRWLVRAYDRRQEEIAHRSAPTLAAARRLLRATRDGADEWIKRAVVANLAALEAGTSVADDGAIVLEGAGRPLLNRFTRRPTGRSFWKVKCPKCGSIVTVLSTASRFRCDIAGCDTVADIERNLVPTT